MLRILANIMLRQAEKTDNPRDYLDSLLPAKFTTASAQGGAITATTVNGKSVTFQAIPGTTLADFMAAANMALEALECGLKVVPSKISGVLR